MEITRARLYNSRIGLRSPTRTLSKTPFEAWFDKRPDLSLLKYIGYTVSIHIPKEKRIKLDWIAYEGQLVGYGGTNQYRIWDPERKGVVSRDVEFDEGFGTQTSSVIIIEPQIISDAKESESDDSELSELDNDPVVSVGKEPAPQPTRTSTRGQRH
jgi:hypothetical protein